MRHRKNEGIEYIKNIASHWGGFTDYLKDNFMYDVYSQTLIWLYTDAKRFKENGWLAAANYLSKKGKLTGYNKP